MNFFKIFSIVYPAQFVLISIIGPLVFNLGNDFLFNTNTLTNVNRAYYILFNALIFIVALIFSRIQFSKRLIFYFAILSAVLFFLYTSTDVSIGYSGMLQIFSGINLIGSAIAVTMIMEPIVGIGLGTIALIIMTVLNVFLFLYGIGYFAAIMIGAYFFRKFHQRRQLQAVSLSN